jgi:hypothetical protein
MQDTSFVAKQNGQLSGGREAKDRIMHIVGKATGDVSAGRTVLQS